MTDSENLKHMRKQTLINARMALRLSTAEAGQLVGVTAKSWENWERRPGMDIPESKFELFCLKVTGDWAKHQMRNDLDIDDLQRKMVVVVKRTDYSVIPITVLAGANFLSYQPEEDGTAVIKSLAVNPVDFTPYVHSVRFEVVDNEHVVKAVKEWRSALYD